MSLVVTAATGGALLMYYNHLMDQKLKKSALPSHNPLSSIIQQCLQSGLQLLSGTRSELWLYRCYRSHSPAALHRTVHGFTVLGLACDEGISLHSARLGSTE